MRMARGARPSAPAAAPKAPIVVPAHREPAAELPRLSLTRPRIRILAIGDGEIPSIELVVARPLSNLSHGLGFDYRLVYPHCLPAVDQCRDIDLLIIARACDPATLALARVLTAGGVPLIFMMDDALELIDPDSVLGQHLRATHAIAAVTELARMATTVIVFSEALARSFSQYSSDVRLMPSIAGIESHLLPEPSLLHPDEVRIGFAGSITHANNLAVVGEALRALLEERPSLVFETIGQPLSVLEGHSRYRHFPFVQGLDAFFALLKRRAWDVGLAPLVDTAFNAAKTDNKYRTYGAAGIPAIFSRVPAFEGSVRHGETGLLVDNDTAAWKATIERVLDDPPLRGRLARAATQDVQERFGLPRVALRYLKLFTRILNAPRILAIGPLHLPTVEIDVRRPLLALSRRRQAQLRLREIAQVSEDDLRWCDMLAVVREANADAFRLVTLAQAMQRRTLYTWDDDFLSIPDAYPELKAHYEAPAQQAAMKAVLASVDLVKCSTTRLAERAAAFNANVVQYPYGFDLSVLSKSVPKRSSEVMTIGYFGSPGRGPEFDFLLTALARVLADRPETKVEFFGVEPSGAAMLPRIIFIPFVHDYAEAMLSLAERGWDIALAPLVANDFNRAKLPTKYRDYGATRIAGVYSRIEPYEAVVIDGETGILTSNEPEDWYQAIVRLIDNASLRRSIADAAFADVQMNHSLDVACDAWLACLERLGLISSASPDWDSSAR
jgi:glycosyltransferase involved in cell wall biosynthesis